MVRRMPYTFCYYGDSAILGSLPVQHALVELRPEADRVLVSVNPRAGRRSSGRRVDRLRRLLDQHGYPVEVFSDLSKAAARANELHALGQLRALVGVGGDGTAAELLNQTEEGVPITLLPAGTANLLSRYLGLSAKPQRLCETIVQGRLLRLDAGRAGDRLFLVNATSGFDAAVVLRVDHRRREAGQGGYSGYLSYLKPILELIRSYQYPKIRVYWEQSCDDRDADQPECMTAPWVFACNLPLYGWGLQLAPDAVANDGLLDLCTFQRRSFLAGLWYAAAAQLGGWHTRSSHWRFLRARRFRLTAEEAVPYQLDGDPGGSLPLDVEVLPNRVTLVVPASTRVSG